MTAERDVTNRLPPPGPSFVREETLSLPAARGEEPRTVRLGMSAPSTTEDGWWLAMLWAADEAGVIEAREVAPRAGPPPGPPLLTIGPAFAASLSSLVAQEEGRQALRLRLPPAADDSRPWARPLIVQLALKWDPIRSAVMRPNELAREVLRAFGRALETTGRPG